MVADVLACSGHRFHALPASGTLPRNDALLHPNRIAIIDDEFQPADLLASDPAGTTCRGHQQPRRVTLSYFVYHHFIGSFPMRSGRYPVTPRWALLQSLQSHHQAVFADLQRFPSQYHLFSLVRSDEKNHRYTNRNKRCDGNRHMKDKAAFAAQIGGIPSTWRRHTAPVLS